ncbi:MAG: hypothetical protein WCP98_04645 [Actinomycetes bacterium]
MPSRGRHELVEVWLWDPGAKRAPFAYESDPLEYLPADAPLPRVGDLILLPPNITGDTREQAFAYAGTRTPFKVMECEHVYFRAKVEKLDPANPKPARHVKTIISVHRLTAKEFDDDRGWSREADG